MKAFVAEADWNPRTSYHLSSEELRDKKADVGSQVWQNPRFEIRSVATPAVGDDAVLIRVATCGICGSDTHTYETDSEGYIIFSGPTKLPCTLGHEFSGVVEKLGKKVTGLRKGDWVAVESIMWCGKCQSCRSGNPNQCKNVELMGLTADGAFAEYVVVDARYCWRINDLKDRYAEHDVFALGALIEPVGCSYNGIFIAGGGFNPGAIAVVYGVGPIGLGAIALSRIAGASMIIAFDVADERLNLAAKMGADFSFNIKKMNGFSPAEKVMELTRGWGADIQIEAAGAAPHTIPEMERSLSSQGKIIYLGRAATSTPMYLDMLVSGANRIIGARGHAGYGIFPSIIRLLAAGKLDLRNMITAQYAFPEVLAALASSVERTDGKILVTLPQPGVN
jgi:threonine dehydrogenase-like Zn-dependent dehydrogenase